MDAIAPSRFAGLGSRAPAYNMAGDEDEEETRVVEVIVPNKVLAARATTTKAAVDCAASPNLCEKPVGADSLTVPITLGVLLPLVALALTLIILHRRHVRKTRREDESDPNKGLDFGLNEHGGGSQRKTGASREKDTGGRLTRRQLSMDMDMSTPYLLPPGLQGSRESLHSLARSLHTEDPYRNVGPAGASDSASLKSHGYGKDVSSIYTGSTDPSLRSARLVMPTRQGSTGPTGSFNLELNSPDSPSTIKVPHFLCEPMNATVEEEVPAVPASGGSASPPTPTVPALQQPAPVLPKLAQGLPPRPKWNDVPVPRASRIEDAVSQISLPDRVRSPETPVFPPALSSPTAATSPQPKVYKAYVPPSAAPKIEATLPGQAIGTPRLIPTLEPAEPTPQSSSTSPTPVSYPTFGDDKEESEPVSFQDSNGNRLSRRHSSDLQEGSEALPEGLVVPQQSSKRLSVGLRPLPPDDIDDSDDPEYRANRIRSFYKEYFEDLAGDAHGPHPPLPKQPLQFQQQQQQRRQQQQQQNMPPPSQMRSPPPLQSPRGRGPPPSPLRGQPLSSRPNHSDQNRADLGDAAAYYDPDTNAFVMPYAQPVFRRAMTPPPSRGFQGRPPPRVAHGSMGGMSASSGPRPGSSVSNRFAGSSRPGSDVSGAGGPRGRNPKPRGPPPAALNTLPTPSKLNEDSMLINPLDFAPPSLGERVRGRSQSPLGERRPYQLNTPIAASPLSSAYDDLAALPSPHLLGGSGTFTGLDFAPPRKFHDGDSIRDAKSDAGSVRSVRSAASNVNLRAIRDGTHLPKETIFDPAAAMTTLKPQWNMHR